MDNEKLLIDDNIENLLNKIKNKKYISIITKNELPKEIINELNLVKVKRNVYKMVSDNIEQSLKNYFLLFL